MMVRGVNVVVGNECADEACVAAYAWAGLPMGSVVVDVGAGVGTSAMLVARAFPHLRFVIQDTPKVVQDAQKVKFLRCVSFGSFTDCYYGSIGRATTQKP